MSAAKAEIPATPGPISGHSEEDDPNAWSSRDLLLLFVAPTVAALLFVGGVYWIQVHVRTGATSQEANGVVQVRLLPRPDPIPIPVAPVARTAMVGSPGPADRQVEAPAETSNHAVVDQPAQTPSVGPIATPNLSPSPTADAPDSPAVLEFRETLLRHIARYQRYPTAAERLRLHGTVRTVFSIGRNGRLLGVWVKTSSGEAMLDQAAIETIRRAQPLPAIPAALPDPLKIEVALGFDPS
jgi:periplasmic protein TonB